ncbi:MAG: ATP-binding cassette domain-containing protein [Spirochaetaceae bacterium]|jgi:ATP-binding cassette subfamily F protein 3|nr:ATP-binding cassette domain-containing protein [Spirochaetaceae bacterium]
MGFVQFSKVSLAFGDRDILKDVSLALASGSRSALAGANGSGKSTLMRVIAGKLPPDAGDRAVQKNCRISYLPQSGIVHRGRTLREEAETAYAGTTALLAQMEEIGKILETVEPEDAQSDILLREYYYLHEKIENSGYYNRDARIASVLAGLGFEPADLARPAEEFSGGWQMRIALAKVLLENPEVLLLDEPTNYLDIEARSWLESWLGSFTGGYLLVSHDRYFLDRTVTEVYELFQGSLKRYIGNYSAYETARRNELAGLVKRWEEQQTEIAKIESLIRRFRYKASKAAFAQELMKRLERMEKIIIPDSLKKISVDFPDPPHSGRITLTLEGIGKRYGGRRIFSDLDLTLESGERLAVVGRNGAGKTTLLRIIAGQDENFEGSLRYGSGVAAGYFSQDASEAMTASEQTLAFLESDAPTELLPKARDMLGAFLFSGDDVYKPVSALSGGEKSRLALLKLFLKPMNLLILDEPTNHLDLQSKDVLLNALKAYSGTIIFVSHDRAFMEALSTKTLELSPQGHRLFYGSYEYYLERIAGEEPAPPQPAAPRTGQSNTALRREADKRRQSIIRRLERQEAEILETLAEFEAEKTRLESELAKPEVYISGEKARQVSARLAEVTSQIETQTTAWEAKALELEAVRVS